jgi:16S rRNA (guanine527-N7)-methyltransferase
MATPLVEFREELERSAPEFGIEFQPAQVERLGAYYELLLKWNSRLHLVAPCSPSEFAVRHVLESLLLLKQVPLNASLVDIGSGAGLPIIPCLLMRDDLSATVIESSQRKGVFLREALRAITPPSRTRLTVARFEDVRTPKVDFLTCRALDRFTEFLPKLVQWAPPGATLILFAGESLRKQIECLFSFVQVEHIPRSEKRFLITAHPEHLTVDHQ